MFKWNIAIVYVHSNSSPPHFSLKNINNIQNYVLTTICCYFHQKTCQLNDPITPNFS